MTAVPTSAARAWQVVALLCAIYIISYADRLILAILVDPVRAELRLNDEQMGLVMGAAFGLPYAICVLAFARVADRGNRHWLIFAGVVTWSLGTLASAYSATYWQLVACRTSVGIGEAALTPAALSLIGDLFAREKRSLAMSVFLASGLVGATGGILLGGSLLAMAEQLAADTLPLISQLAPWRIVLVLLAIPGLLLAPLLVLTSREPDRTGDLPAVSFAIADIGRHLQQNARLYMGTLVAIGLVQMIAYGMASWYPSLLIRRFGMSPANVGIAYGLVGLISGVSGAIMVPMIAHRRARKGQRRALVDTALLCILVSAPALAFAFAFASSAAWSLAAAAPGLFFLLGLGALGPIAAQILPPAGMGAQVTAVFLVGANVLGMTGAPLIVATVSERFAGSGSLGIALALLVGVVTPVGIVLTLFARPAARRADLRLARACHTVRE